MKRDKDVAQIFNLIDTCDFLHADAGQCDCHAKIAKILADTRKDERRRAARIVKKYADCVCDKALGIACAKEILGKPKKGAR